MLDIPPNHSFLQITNERYPDYLASMNDVIDIVSAKSRDSSEKTRLSISHKLQLLGNAQPDRDQYLQHACELSVAAYFCRLPEADFSYEYPSRNGKNIDVSVVYNGVRFNIEVKCPNPKSKPKPSGTTKLRLRTHGRLSSIHRTTDDLNKLAELVGYDGLLAVPNSDHKIKEALIDSARKIRVPVSELELNCVVLCADDGDSLEHYWHCLYGAQGLFTGASFHSPEDYSVVDAIILTNLRHRHDNAFRRQGMSDPWLLESAFNLVLENQLRVKRKAPDISLLANLVPHYGRQLDSFQVPGDAPLEVLNNIKLSYFVENEMEKFDPYCFGAA